MTEPLGDALLATPAGVAFLAAGEASGRLDAVLGSVGATLCLTGHALAEVRRGTDDGRIATLLDRPPAWLRAAAGRVSDAERAGRLDWWSPDPTTAVHRLVGPRLTSVEVLDEDGRRRSLAEEAGPHLHTFTGSDRAEPLPRLRPSGARIVTVDRPQDLLAEQDADALHLSLRGVLTVPHRTLDSARWPWEVGGVVWRAAPSGDPLPPDTAAPHPHDHGWVLIGRSFDPRFDEGDEIDGSELAG